MKKNWDDWGNLCVIIGNIILYGGILSFVGFIALLPILTRKGC